MGTGAYDVIVVGLGAWGASCAQHLAARGRRVLALDRYAPPHDRGSSHGTSRIVRLATNHGPAYTPMFLRAFELLDDLAGEAGLELTRRCGGLSVAPPGHQMNAGLAESYERHELPYQVLGWAEMQRRFPWLAVRDGEEGIWDETARVVCPERVVEAQLALALRHGAELRTGERVTGWEPAGDGLRVTTEAGRYEAGRLVLATGSWLPVLAGFPLPFAPERQIQMWFQPAEHAEWFLSGELPWLLAACDPPAEYSYAMPDFVVPGVKFGLHRGGRITHPDEVERAVRPEEIEAVRTELRRRIPALDGELLLAKTCIYENSADLDYIVGPHPEQPAVVLAGGGSGRGFAFSLVVGEIVADLLEGRQRFDIGLFAPARFASA